MLSWQQGRPRRSMMMRTMTGEAPPGAKEEEEEARAIGEPLWSTWAMYTMTTMGIGEENGTSSSKDTGMLTDDNEKEGTGKSSAMLTDNGEGIGKGSRDDDASDNDGKGSESSPSTEGWMTAVQEWC